MKRFLFIMIFFVFVVSSTFASKTSIVVQISPFSFQNVSATNGSYKSTYGYGFGVGFRYEAWKNVNLGADIDMSFYNYKQLLSSYNVISLRAVGGYSCHINDKFFVLGELGVGIDNRSIGTANQVNLGFGVKLKAVFNASESFKVTVGSALDLSFQKTKSERSTDFAIRPFIGLIATL